MKYNEKKAIFDLVDTLWPKGKYVKQVIYNITNNSVTIINNDNSTTIINLSSGVAGDGMDYSENDPVTLGLPSTVDSTTINEVTETSHTHELGDIDISNITKGIYVKYGALYNWWAATDVRNIAPEGWHVPTRAEFVTLREYLDPIGGGSINTNVAGKKLKEIGLTYWLSPNTGSNNEVGFNARGAGWREISFGLLKNEGDWWTTTDYNGNNRYGCGVAYNYDGLNTDNFAPVSKTGLSIRLIKDDSIDTGSMMDNNGNSYPTVTIGTQVWMSCNLNTSKYRNGDWISGFDNGIYTPISDVNWNLLTTEYMCYYLDDETNGSENIYLTSQHNDLDGLQGGNTTERYHHTAAEKDAHVYSESGLIREVDGKIQIGGETNYIEVEADGTIRFAGDATVFEDEKFDALTVKVQGSGVSLNTTELTVDFTTGANQLDFMMAAPQFRHARKSGSAIYPHLHFSQAQNNIPNFAIQYRWQINGAAKTTAWTAVKCNTPIFTYVSGTLNQILETASPISAPVGDNISDIVQFKIIRDTGNNLGLSYGADPYTATASILSFDIHVEIDTIGSREEYSK